MTDSILKKHRSWNMSRIKSVDTKPELIVRRSLFKLGFRFRLNGEVAKKYYPKGKLPGSPDIVLAKYKTVIFVHGCFWHHHSGCKKANWPKSNKEYWIPKIKNNIIRDTENIAELKELGWKVWIIWECEITEKILIKRINKIVNNMNNRVNCE